MKDKTGLEHKSIIWIKNTDRELKPIGETMQLGGKNEVKSQHVVWKVKNINNIHNTPIFREN